MLTGLAVLEATDAERPETWAFQAHHSWWGPPLAAELSTPEARTRFFRQRFGRLCEPFRTSILTLGEDAMLPLDPGQEWSPVPWDNRHGQITLAGDAAHSMLPRKSKRILSRGTENETD